MAADRGSGAVGGQNAQRRTGRSPGVLRSGGRTLLRARSFDGPRRSANLDCLEAQQARGSNDQRNTETSASQRAGATTGGGAAGQVPMNSGARGDRRSAGAAVWSGGRRLVSGHRADGGKRGGRRVVELRSSATCAGDAERFGVARRA